MNLVIIKRKPYQKVMAAKPPKHKLPTAPFKPSVDLVRKIFLNPEVISDPYELKTVNMERAGNGPWLILMNHSSVYDVKIVYDILKDKDISPVVTAEAAAGRGIVVKLSGGIVAKKYISEIYLIKDMVHALKENKSNILMYPEAGCSLDGTSLKLHKSFGSLFKLLKVPVVMITGYGTFLHTPTFNTPYKRKSPVHVTMECLLTPEEIAEKSKDEINEIVEKAFVYDQFKWQYDNKIKITESTRAEGLERVLYKCPHCMAEFKNVSTQTVLECTACGKKYEMTEYGQMKAIDGKTEFSHIPDWFAWERKCVVDEIAAGTYSYDCDGDIAVLRDMKALYIVGKGHLHSDLNGITVTSDDGEINVHHAPLSTYSIACDYKMQYWGDSISIGDVNTQYYLLTDKKSGVAKVKLAAEEIYSYYKKRKKLH